MMTMRLGWLLPLVAMAGLTACRQDVPLPVVSAPLDASSRESRPRPSEEEDAAVADSGQPAAESDAGSCNGGVRQVSFRQFHAQVILAVDRSASMGDKPAGASSSRWQMVQNVLRSLMRTYHQAVYFGYVEFPALECRHGVCCSGGFIPPSPSHGAIERKWTCGQTTCPARSADSPAGFALYESRHHFETAEQSSGSRHVFLITDGEPSCGEGPNMAACDQATKEVAELVGQDIRTTIFAMDPALKTSTCLSDLTAIGSGGQLYTSADETALRDQLEAILSPLATESCSFRLREALLPPERLALRINGTSLLRDPSRKEGWEFDADDDMSHFTVYGSWCAKLRESEVYDIDAYVCSR